MFFTVININVLVVTDRLIRGREDHPTLVEGRAELERCLGVPLNGDQLAPEPVLNFFHVLASFCLGRLVVLSRLVNVFRFPFSNILGELCRPNWLGLELVGS